MKIKKLKRFLALLLASLMIIMSITYSTCAEDSASLIRRKNIFQGHTVYLFGQRHNEMGFYQVQGIEPVSPTFCIQPGKRMPNGSAAPYVKYTVTSEGVIPGIGPAEKFLPITCACNWIFYYTDRGNIPYAVTQTYIWGCMAGYADDWSAQEEAMQQLVPILGDSVMIYYEQMKSFIISEEERYSSSTMLPSWNGTQQKMLLIDGGYSLTLDISTCAALKDVTWTFPDANWSYTVAMDGNSITFRYNGATGPQGTVMSSELPGTDVLYQAEIFSPPGFQEQVGRLSAEVSPAVAQFIVEPDMPWGSDGAAQLELYRHSETFESNYNIDLEKYCAETNQPLEGTTFNVWEDFDFSQVNESGYAEGNPDGTMGEVYLNCMSPEPESDYICDTITTDTNGQASHSDVRFYNYSKTYCMGHPAPDWIECDHDGGEGEDAEDCDCDEENERLREQWMAEQELCASTCDFHVQNDDEDNQSQDTTAMEAMLADRDATYEHYINLEYSYHLAEKTARTGYILHGLHSDDLDIETVILASAQAGGNVRSGTYKAGSIVGKVLDPIYNMAVASMNGLRAYTYPVPDDQELNLDEQRNITSIWKEREKKSPVEIEKPADNIVDGAGGKDGADLDSGTQEPGDTENKNQGTGESGNEAGETVTPGTEGSEDTGQESGGSESGNSGTGESGSETPEGGETGGEASGTGESGGEIPGTGESGGEAPETGESGGEAPETGKSGSEAPETGKSGTESPQTVASGTGAPEAGKSDHRAARTKESESGSQKNGEPKSDNHGTEDTGNESQVSKNFGNKTEVSGLIEAKNSGSIIADRISHNKNLLFAPGSDDNNIEAEQISERDQSIISDAKKAKSVKEETESYKEDTNDREDNDKDETEDYEDHEEDLENADPENADPENADPENPDPEKVKDPDVLKASDALEDPQSLQEPDTYEESASYEQYEYTRNPIRPSFDLEIQYTEYNQEPEEGNTVIRFLTSLFSEDNDDHITVSLPGFIDDTIGPIDTSAYGNAGDILYTFKIWDHRTEGRIHINKRDLELYQADKDNSYGQTQGDGTLEGAVYGLFAAQDILHPDGKSGVVYNQNDLVAVAATDKNGDASFLVCTEQPGTRQGEDGTIMSPDGLTGPESLYNGSSITSSGEGFGTVTYPDYIAVNGNPWIGRPLLMGSYYIRELSRSEGYELSVNGLMLTESNRTQDGVAVVREAGQARVTGGLSDYNNMDADGSWNDFIVESYKTENGYDIAVSGYPENARFYRVDSEDRVETEKIVTGSSLQPKLDEHGNPVYQTARGGEYKTGPDGNPIIKQDTATDSNADERIPYSETLFYRFRTAPYPSGNASPADLSKWAQAIDEAYLISQVNGMLKQIKYKSVSDQSPWADLELTGSTNALAAGEIMDWFTDHNFFDCGEVESVYEKDGSYHARLRYDYSLASDTYPAVYDSVNQKVFIQKTASMDASSAVDPIATAASSTEVRYWLEYSKGDYSLKSKTVTVREKKAVTQPVTLDDEIEARIETIYQPVYETYQPGENLTDSSGNPIPVMERVITYMDAEVTNTYEKLVPVNAAYDTQTQIYTIHVENTTDWGETAEAIHTVYRVVTGRKTMDHDGMEMPYNQYLTDIQGAGVSAYAAISPLDAGSYVVSQTLNYPGQNQPVQDGGTETRPVQVLQRAIKQSIKITKSISQVSYDDVNTYGSLHNDPLTVLLGLFNGGSSSQGTRILNQFKFKAYLKSNLENIFVDDSGVILSENVGIEDFKGDVQKIYLPPENGGGHRLLEQKEDGTYNYTKFFDAMYAADQKTDGAYPVGGSYPTGSYPKAVIRQFAVDYYDIDSYKKAILEETPSLNSDVAYDLALKKAEEEAARYLDIFAELDPRLAIAWDRDPLGGTDGDVTTLQCNTKNGKDDYYNHSILLPYGTYVIAEQTPANVDKELANRHFNRDWPREIVLPFVPDISQDANTGETDVNDQTGSPFYRYNREDTPEDLIRKYKIRFNVESHIIQAHGQDGDFEVYKYGLDQEIQNISQSEHAGHMDPVVYNGYETDSGQMEVRDNVAVMTGMQTAIDGKFAPMLVPWTVLSPAVDRINPDTGNVETLAPSGAGEDFNFVAFAQEDFEDTYYSSRLRIEKMDAETGDTILHDGALFQIYAAKRAVEKSGTNTVSGTGDVLFGEAVDWEGKTVVDADGNPIMYPRVGRSNAGTDDLPIRLDREGVPQYDQSQLIRQEDKDGNETGIFKAYSTVWEVVIDGQVQNVPVGYIETYRPLGAGAYVLVEVQAPGGYTKSRPVAFEVYSDDVVYYKDQRNRDGTTDGWKTETAVRYQYAVPVSGETNKFASETVSRIVVEDYPSRMEIHKVEDGDSMVGNQNGLQKTDAQGETELSGGFDEHLDGAGGGTVDGDTSGNATVNDAGDHLTYKVHGRREKLEERGDVRDISYDPETGDWYGEVTKTLDEYSEQIIEGTEKVLKEMPAVKLLYRLDGTFTGKGIRFDIPVSGAGLSLYRAMELEKTGENQYKGVSVIREDGKVTGITDTNTGTHKEIRVTGQDTGPASMDVWDTVVVENEPVNLYYYDLEQTDTWLDPVSGELHVLDQHGNQLCFADPVSGMAYVYDDYGRMLAYTADETGEKELVKSIQVLDDGTGQTIYEDKVSVDDENGLPIYYTDGHVVVKDESWITDHSTDPYGEPETAGAVHTITRLAFGAYILQEESVPYEQGYIQSVYMGLVLRDTDQVQKYFMQNEFTKTAFAKLDVRTQKEIQGATMTLYRAMTDGDGNPVCGDDGIYKKGEIYASWISGCLYDDNGNLKLDEHGQLIPTDKPHWIDHIPVGFYVLEETVCPYEQGYVQSLPVNIEVEETGHVQSFEMEDDFTAIDIRKYDTENQEVIYEDSDAYLTLYRAKLDDRGNPVIQDGIPQYDETGRIVTFRAATYKDGQNVAATGRVTPDAGGNHAIIKYDYDIHEIPGTCQARYYYTEEGNTRFEYLPVGSYVLTESLNPDGYATSDPVLILIRETGHLETVQYAEMGDKPLELEVSKVTVSGGREVSGAKLTIYPVDEEGTVSDTPLVLHQPAADGSYQDITASWVSGMDGTYEKEDQENGRIPPGFEVGDLKPHLIRYIPEGNYILREETTPYGFLQSTDLPFTIKDTQIIQKTEMTDEIPDGILKITKSDTDRPDEKLQGAQFRLENQTTGHICETVTTDILGQVRFQPQPIGTMDREGHFQPYTYVCREIKASPGHMLTLKPYEFQFEYENESIGFIILEYNPTNDSNRVITDKLLGDTGEMLEGVTLRIERRKDGGTMGWELIEEWVTGRQSHYTKDLPAGYYRLTEVKAQEGFQLLAEPIEFTITDGMETIPHLTMRNYSTVVDIRKTREDTGQLLAGARLQLIRKETGEVLLEWTTQERVGRKFYGLAAGTYIIHEIQAPSGYDVAADQEIVVTDDDRTVQVFHFANKLTSSSGGGGGDHPKPRPEYISFKKVNTEGIAVQGAQFTFYNQDGTVIATSVSDASGTFSIRKPKDGTYTFKETKAPAGFGLDPNIHSFTVSGSEVIRGEYEIMDQELHVVIKKVDGDTGQPLGGAVLRIEKAGEAGEECQTGEDGTAHFTPDAPGIYIIREITPPSGYTALDTEYEFTVSADGQVSGNTTLYNWKEKIPEKRIGKITAVYKVKNRFGKGTFHFGSGIKYKVRTGDHIPIVPVAVTAILCLTGFAACMFREEKRRWSRGKKMAAVLAVLILTGILFPHDIMAEDNGYGQKQLPKTIYVSDEIQYSGMESVEPVPQSVWIWAYDSAGRQKVLLPLTSYHFINRRWEKGFQLDVTVTDYGADRYLLDDKLIELQENEFPEACKEILLLQAGLDGDAYRIEHFQWKGDSYEKDGRQYRDLTAVGSKVVADCIATYSGEVNRDIFDENRMEGQALGAVVGAEDDLPGSEGIMPEIRIIIVCILTLIGAFLITVYLKRKRKLQSLLSILFLSGFVISTGYLLRTGLAYNNGRNVYRAVRETAYRRLSAHTAPEAGQNQPVSPNNSQDIPDIDEAALSRQNPEYQFWLSVPGTGIDYPVVLHEDNQYYLNHDFTGEEQITGSIFADCSSIPLAVDHTIVYGHNMKDGSMFAGLKKYQDEAFYREHKVIRIFYQGKWLDCPVLSCQIRQENDAGAYRTNLLTDEWEDYLTEMERASLYETETVPAGDEKLITLSTCINKKDRLIVQALLQDKA